MKKLLALPVLVLVSILMVSSMAVPATYAAGPSQKWSTIPYFQVNGNATLSPKGLDANQVWNAYSFSKLSCSMTSTAGWEYVNLCGHGQVIAIVDAYDDPTIENDLATFDSQEGLPQCTTANGCFEKLTPSGAPPANSTWAMEESLDVEWAHATAPGAKIVLVESQSNGFRNLIHAINYTEAKTGASEVSMGWGIPEFTNETLFDSYFEKSGIVFFAPSGNGNVHIYPSASPYVLSVGGTTLDVTAAGTVKNEIGWSGGAGGPSYFEQEPHYQITYDIDSNAKRAVPDVSYDADPHTGFSVYDSTAYHNQTGWFTVGGTSAGVPQWAAIAAIANSQGGSLSSYRYTTISDLYTAATGTLYTTYYHDITQGGTVSTPALPGYDFATGLGSPISNTLISFLSPKPTASTVPLHLTAVAANRQVTLSWQPPIFVGGSPITKYHIYRGAAPGGEMILDAVPPTNQTYVDLWLENGEPYYYYVTAVNAAGESHGSNEATATPRDVSSPPQNLVASMIDGQVSLTWQPPANANGSPITEYNIYKGTSTGQEMLYKTISNSTESFPDTNVTSAQSYYYFVTAINSGGESAPSNEVSVTQPPTVSTPPQNLNAVATSNQITLSWQPPASDGGSTLVKYNIYEGTTGGQETFLSSVPPNVSHYTNSYVVNGASYFYYVTAINSLGESPKSNEVSAVPG